MKYCYGLQKQPLFCKEDCCCDIIEATTIEEALHGKRIYMVGRDGGFCVRDEATKDNALEKEIQQKIIECSADMARIIIKDHNCEIRKDKKDGIRVFDVIRKPVK